jgi:hypothetical protein
MKYWIPALAFSALLYSCSTNTKTEERKVAISYEMKTFRLESKGGCSDNDTLACASFEINFPVFTGLPQPVLDSLAKEIAMSVSTGNPEMDSLSFEQDGRTFIAEFESFRAESPDFTMGWTFDATVEVSVNGDSLLSLVATNESFTGGAHGSYGTYFINLDPKTGKKITLSDLLKPGYESALIKAGEEEFRSSLEMSDSIIYSEEGYEFADDIFSLNDNYGFTKEGIRFVFNIYEIAPYALGAQDFVIPYEKMKDWLK